MSVGTLLIRADASVAIGSGHVMRCLALAQAWQDAGGTSVLAATELPAALEERIRGELEVVRFEARLGMAEEILELAKLAHDRNAARCVLDGVHFAPEYVNALRRHGQKILWLDDCGSTTPCNADLILNMNLGASADCYPWCREPGRLLLGTEYVLLRREFLRSNPRTEVSNVVPEILVAFGGSDPDGMTGKVLLALASNRRAAKVTAVAGGANPQIRELEGLASSTGATFLCDPPDLPEIMTRSDLALIAGGGTLWELLYSGCAVLSYSRNSVQASVIARLAAAGAVCDLGPTTAFDAKKLQAAVVEVGASARARSRLKAGGRGIVDGLGAARVIRRLRGE